MADEVTEIDRKTELDSVYVLQQRGDGFEVLVDGQRVLRSITPRIEREVVDVALAPWGTRDDLTILCAGLGMGLTVRAFLDWPQVKHVDVVERSATVVAWCGAELAALNGGALRDPRVSVIVRELGEYLRGPGEGGARPEGWFVLLLDTDQWPGSLWRPENVEFYHEDGLLLLETALRPGGVLVISASHRDDELEQRLRNRFQSVARIAVPTDVDGESRLAYIYRGRRSSVGGGQS